MDVQIRADVDGVRSDGRVVHFKINGHSFRSLDTTAGIRAYTGPRGATRFWHGFYNQKAVDHYTGAALAVVVDSASRQEYASTPSSSPSSSRRSAPGRRR